jgi:hypothetical protein
VEHPNHDRQDAPLVSFNQVPEGILVALARLLDQVPICSLRSHLDAPQLVKFTAGTPSWDRI